MSGEIATRKAGEFWGPNALSTAAVDAHEQLLRLINARSAGKDFDAKLVRGYAEETWKAASRYVAAWDAATFEEIDDACDYLEQVPVGDPVGTGLHEHLLSAAAHRDEYIRMVSEPLPPLAQLALPAA